MSSNFLFGLNVSNLAQAQVPKLLPLKKKIGEKTTICPYDASGGGFLATAENGKVVNIEGDPDYSLNRGAACTKGASIRQLFADNPWRLSKVLYWAPAELI